MDAADEEGVKQVEGDGVAVGRGLFAGLQQFIEMLQRDRAWGDSLAKKSLIDAFRVVEDEDLVGRYRRKMSSLLLV